MTYQGDLRKHIHNLLSVELFNVLRERNDEQPFNLFNRRNPLTICPSLFRYTSLRPPGRDPVLLRPVALALSTGGRALGGTEDAPGDGLPHRRSGAAVFAASARLGRSKRKGRGSGSGSGWYGTEKKTMKSSRKRR